MTSKLSVKLYKGNYKWVQNQLRLFAAYKVCGVLDPRKVSRSLGGMSARPFHLAYLFILSLSFRPFFPNAALWLCCPQWQLSGSFWGLCLRCVTWAGSWFHDCCLSLGWWRSQSATHPSYSQSQKSSSQSLQTHTPYLSLGSSESPKPNMSTTVKPEPSCQNLPAGKLNGLESFIPEWSLLSNTSKHIAHAHRGLACQPSAHMQEL